MARSSSGLRIALLVLSILAAFLPGCGGNTVGTAQSVATLAGAPGGPGYFDGAGKFVRFSSPSGVAVVGTNLFVTDTANHVVRKVDTVTGTVSTLAGSAGNPGSADNTVAANARFNSPTGIATDGTFLFVTDTGNHTIRKIVISSGATTTLAGSAGNPGSADNTVANARFNSPTGIAFDASSSSFFVADTGNHTIRQIASGAVTTLAGSAGNPGSTDNTVAANVRFNSPTGIAFDTSSASLFVADTVNRIIRQTALSGSTTTVPVTSGAFASPVGLVAAIGTTLYVCDNVSHTISSIPFGGGPVTVLAGLGGNPGSADGTGSAARFSAPKGIGTLSPTSSILFVVDTGNHAIRQLSVAGAVSTVAGNPPQSGVTDGTGAAARFRAPGIGVTVMGDNVFLSDDGNRTIRMITPSGVVSTVPGTTGAFASPAGVAAIGTTLYVCDNVNHTISSVTTGGIVTILAGLAGTSGFTDNTTGANARFNAPQGIATDGTNLFVADTGNKAIRKVTTAGAVTTLPGTTGAFQQPVGIAVLGTNIFVTDPGNHTIRKLPIGGGIGSVLTFAGSGQPGFLDGSGTSAQFSSPRGIAAVGSVLYLADTGNHAVRRISTTGTVTTFVGRADAATTRDGDAPQALLNAPAGVAGIPGTLYFTDQNENVVRKILF